jgi:hypothetical protein
MYEGMEPFVLIKPLPVSTPCSRRDAPPSDRSEAAVWSLDNLAERLCIFHARYTLYFITRTRSVVELAKENRNGLDLASFSSY